MELTSVPVNGAAAFSPLAALDVAVAAVALPRLSPRHASLVAAGLH